MSKTLDFLLQNTKKFWVRGTNLLVKATKTNRRHGGPMFNVLISGLSSPGLSPGQGHCVAFLDNTVYFHSASLLPVVLMGTGKLSAGG